MAVITTDTYLDWGTTRTAGETWTINGWVLTIRTDTRVHANAPAWMLGSLGNITISSTLGGGVLLDARNVRWLSYNIGTGSVPAIGTSITQWGVSGYLLGVYSAINAAPTTAGWTMPTSGFIKFREVTGGAYSSGTLTGIGATATAPDVLGWIEVVHDQAIAITVPRLGYYRTRWGWFYLDSTTWAIHQSVSTPTNGWWSATMVPWVEIETAPLSWIFEKFPAVSATYFTAANIETDERSKFVLMDTNGNIRIGGNGTTAIWYLPPAGCRIRIPNVIGRQTSAANRTLNLVPHATITSRPDFTTTSAGEIDMEYIMNDWYHLFTSPYKVRMLNVFTMDIHTTSNEASPTYLENYLTGAYRAGFISFTGLNNPLGGIIKDCKFFRPDAATNGHCMLFTGVSNVEFQGTIESGVITYARSTGKVFLNQCRNFKQTGTLITYASGLSINTCANIDIALHRYVDRIVGTTNAVGGNYANGIYLSCDNVILRSTDFGWYTNVHPYLWVHNFSNSTNITLRWVGTYNNPIGGTINAPAYVFADSGNNDTIRIQEHYLTATRTSVIFTSNTSKNITLERVCGTLGYVDTKSVNTITKWLRSTGNSTTWQASVYGTHWFDMFTNDTIGLIWLAMNEPTTFSASQYEAVSLGTGAGFTSGGQIAMPNAWDQIIFEQPNFLLGHIGFGNFTPVITGVNTGNFTFEYQLDTGSGYSSWKTLNATNLFAEIVTTKLRMKWRITTVIASLTNAITYIRIATNTTSLAQSLAHYPLDNTTIKITGIIPNSRVQIYDTTNSTELYNGIVTGPTLTYTTPYVSDFTARVRVMYQSTLFARKFLEFSEDVTVSWVSRWILQEYDDIYMVNAIDGSTITNISIDDGTFLVNVSTGSVSLQSIYAYETYWLMTEQGIRDESRFITAQDQANYIFEDFNIKNIQAGNFPLVITGGYMKDSVTKEAIDVIDTTGGTIFLAPEHVVPFITGGWWGSGGDTKEDIYGYFTASGRQNTFKADTTGLALETTAQAIKVKTDVLVNADLSWIALTTNIADAVTSIKWPDNKNLSQVFSKPSEWLTPQQSDQLANAVKKGDVILNLWDISIPL